MERLFTEQDRKELLERLREYLKTSTSTLKEVSKKIGISRISLYMHIRFPRRILGAHDGTLSKIKVFLDNDKAKNI